MAKGENNKAKRYKEKICQIVPTRDRPQELRRLLESLQPQSYQFDQIIIVDGSIENPVKELLHEFADLALTYITQNPPGLALQRKAGIRAVAPEITLVGYLDDDVVLEPGCVEIMYDFWETAGSDVGGAEYNIVYDSQTEGRDNSTSRLYDIFMLRDKDKKGVVLKSGIGISPYPAKCTVQVQWLSGGANVYRREIIEKYEVDDWFVGWGVGDDLEFSYRVSKDYRLFVVAEAHLKHLPPPVKSGKSYLCSKIATINHFYFVRKNSEFALWGCAWANFGMVLSQFYKGLISFNPNNFQHVAGKLTGIYKGLTGTLKPVDSIVK